MRPVKTGKGKPSVKDLLEALENNVYALEGLEHPQVASFRAAMDAVRKSLHKPHKKSATLVAKTRRATGLDKN